MRPRLAASSPPSRATPGPVRVLVGARTPRAPCPALAAALRRLGARAAACSARPGWWPPPCPPAPPLAAALGADPRVAYVERDRELRVAADPFDSVDVDPRRLGHQVHVGLRRGARRGAPCAAAGGGSRHRIAVVDTGRRRGPARAGRAHRRHLRHPYSKGTSVTDRVGHGTFVAGLIAARRRQRHRRQGRGRQHPAAGGPGLARRQLHRGPDLAGDRGRGAQRSADVINMSLAGRGFSVSQLRALQARLLQRRPARWPRRQQRRQRQPARVPRRGARRRARTARDRPVGDRHAPGRRVRPPSPRTTPTSASPRPGAGADRAASSASSRSCPPTGRPTGTTRSPARASSPRPAGASRYGEGTSFAAPFASGIAALVWQVRAAPGLRAGGRRAHPLGAPDRRPRLEPAHRRGHRGRRGGHGAGAGLRRDAPADARHGPPPRRDAAWGCASRAPATARAAATSSPATSRYATARLTRRRRQLQGRAPPALSRSATWCASRAPRVNVLVATASATATATARSSGSAATGRSRGARV